MINLLSFDVTDKQFKVVKGIQAGGKIRISRTVVIDIPEGLIIDGHIQDIQALATIVNDCLRDKKMTDKEAVISISSGQIVFKELIIPKAKGSQLLTIVQNQMQYNMGISKDYSISYTIVGEGGAENPNTYKILASACPHAIVNGFKKMFNFLSIQLKSASVSSNCISRVVLANNKTKEMMPLLVVQIDENFISINLYEENQLAFSRLVTIDKEDYASGNYIQEALNENVFRMIQFNRARGGTGIKDIIFYGDVRDYINLTKALEQQDVRTHILAVPPQVLGYESFEFTAFANAIGAMYKKKKDTERVNLLEADATVGNKAADSSFIKVMALVCVACIALLAGVYFIFELQDKSVLNDTTNINAYMSSTSTVAAIKKIDNENNIITKIQAYNLGVLNANKALQTKPIMKADIMRQIRTFAAGKATISGFSFTNGSLSVELSTADIAFPATCVETIKESGYFASVSYTGFMKDTVYVFTLNINMKAGEVK